MGVIYAIENAKNGRRYIGSTVDEVRRQKEHFSQLNAGSHFNTHLQRAFVKYGEKTFDWLILENDIQEMNLIAREKYWISQTRDVYNTAEPNAPMRGRKHTAEAKAKIGRKGILHNQAKLTDDKVRQIFQMHNDGLNQKEIAHLLKVHDSTVSLVLCGKGWKHLKMNINGRANSTSGIVGVYFVKGCGKWKAEIIRNGTYYGLGMFATKEAAGKARALAERRLLSDTK